MIDEKKLIEDLKKHFDALYKEDGTLLQSDHICISEDVEDLIKFINEQPKTDWIPCTVVDHPEHCNNCEVTIKDTIGYFRDIAYYTDKWRRLADEMPVNVIAWKEPSIPYKKEGAE